jgi:ribosome-associated heat shock protein Hsp15
LPPPTRKRRAQRPDSPQAHDDAPEDTASTEKASTQRLDKWLWFARFARTRTLAARLVEGGKVRVNREKILKPAQNVKMGDVITAAVGGRVRVARITSPGVRRGPADEARGLYEDLTPALDEENADGESPTGRAAGGARPTKRERRKLDAARARAGETGE